MPRYLRQRGNNWEGADHPDGPWRIISSDGITWAPWGRPTASALQETGEPNSVTPEPVRTPSDRMALAVCRGACPVGGPCPVEAICSDCRRDSTAVARELAQILRERHGGSSAVADWLDGVGAHP